MGDGGGEDGIVGGPGKIIKTSLAGGWNKRGDWKIPLNLVHFFDF